DALNILSRLFVREGVQIAVENPSYSSIITLLRSYGASPVAIAVDEDGICPHELYAARPKLIYTTPSHQFPTGVVMSPSRRQELLIAAEAINAYIIEDDYDGEIIYDRPPLAALAALDHSRRVIYVGSFSKSIGAGLRLGYLVAPHELIDPIVSMKSI